VLRKERLNAIVHEHPEVLLEVTKTMSQRLRATNEQLEERATEEIRLSGGAAKAG
jgi:CRP-like cAMP-binding protein